MAQAVFSHLHKAILSCLFSDSGFFFLPLSLLNILLFRHVVGRRHCCCKEQYNKTDWICWVVAGYGHRPVIFVVDGIKEFFFVNNKKDSTFRSFGTNFNTASPYSNNSPFLFCVFPPFGYNEWYTSAKRRKTLCSSFFAEEVITNLNEHSWTRVIGSYWILGSHMEWLVDCVDFFFFFRFSFPPQTLSLSHCHSSIIKLYTAYLWRLCTTGLCVVRSTKKRCPWRSIMYRFHRPKNNTVQITRN